MFPSYSIIRALYSHYLFHHIPSYSIIFHHLSIFHHVPSYSHHIPFLFPSYSIMFHHSPIIFSLHSHTGPLELFLTIIDHASIRIRRWVVRGRLSTWMVTWPKSLQGLRVGSAGGKLSHGLKYGGFRKWRPC